MECVQGWLFHGYRFGDFKKCASNNGTASVTELARNVTGLRAMFDIDTSHARQKLNPSRLTDQMFAYTVTNQIIDTFREIGLPFVLRFFSSSRNHSKGGKKRVLFEDEVGAEGTGENSKEEREFLEIVRKEAALPDYELFTDYNEMVTQFGYITLWSTIWPLAPGTR